MKKSIIVLIVVLLATTLVYGEAFIGTGNWDKEITVSKEKINVEISTTDKNIAVDVYLEDENFEEVSLVNGSNTIKKGTYTLFVECSGEWKVTIGNEKVTPPKKDAPKVNPPKVTPPEKDTPKVDKWPTMKTFKIASRSLVVKLRKVNYKWKKMNVDPFLQANKEWTMKKRIYLAINKAGWKKEVADGLWAQAKLAMDTDEKEGMITREVKKGRTIQWMYSGGVRNNEITLDVGKITVDIEYYYKYHYDTDGKYTHREKIEMDKDSHINAKSYTFAYEGTVYELLWFEGSLGGISQCGNLAGTSYPATK
jgi:hypothetical protein